jgi:hypothetical protein
MKDCEIQHTRIEILEYIYNNYIDGLPPDDINFKLSFKFDITFNTEEINSMVDYMNRCL